MNENKQNMILSEAERKKLIPSLRFPEFKNDGEWVEKKLGEMAMVIVGGTPRTNVSEYWNGNIGWIGSGELKNNIIKSPTKYITKSGLNNSSAKLLPKGTTVLAMTGATLGKIGYLDFECSGNQSVAGFVKLEKLISKFLFYNLQTVTNNIISLAGGGAQSGINKDNIKKIKIPIPTLPEQQKIASFLSNLDELIAAHKQKLALLKQHKKGLMQRMFPQENGSLIDNGKWKIDNEGNNSQFSILNSQLKKVPEWRFPEFQNDGEWVEKKLGEVAKFLKGKGISKSDIDENGNLPCIRYGELYTHYNETIKEIKSYTNLDKENLVLSKENDVIIPSSGETQIDIATASCVLIRGVALGGDLNIIRSNVNGIFLSYYLNNAKKRDIAQIAQGISVVHLYANQLKTLKMNIPSKKEQQKIADFLSNLDELITAQAEKIEQLERHKKGLMQKIFPMDN